MLVKGYWAQFSDEVIRPIINIEIALPDGSWKEVTFLLDSGADRTVLDATLLPFLEGQLLPRNEDLLLGGIGGQVETRTLQATLGFTRDDGKRTMIKGRLAIFTALESSEFSVLGRDVTDNFDVIYSFPKREVLLLAPPHTYVTQLPF